MDVILRKDSDWSAVNGEACRVIEFTPFAKIEEGKVVSLDPTMPYASVTFECVKFSQGAVGSLPIGSTFSIYGLLLRNEVLVTTKRA